MSDEDLPSIFGSISALKAVVPKSEGPRKGEVRADAELVQHLGDGLKGAHWQGELRGEAVAVHVLRKRVTEVGRASFQESVDKLVTALRGKRAPGILKPVSLAADRSAFTTRLCVGGTLADVTSDHEWGLGQRLIAIATVAEALEQLHDHEITHGALSPAAILFDADGSPWISGVDGQNLLVGTPGDSADPHAFHTYASPEAKFGDPIDARSDVYSLGRVLHYLLSGKHLLPKDEDRPKLEELSSQPAGLVRIVRKCTRQNPNDRYQSIGDFLADLVRYPHHDKVGTKRSDVDELEVARNTADPLLAQFDRQRTKPVSRVILDLVEGSGPADGDSTAADSAKGPHRSRGRSSSESTDKAEPNHVIVACGGAIVIASILLSFLGGDTGMVAGPIIALFGAGIAAMGLAKNLT